MLEREDQLKNEEKRKKAIEVANSLPIKSLTIEQASALMPLHPEWD